MDTSIISAYNAISNLPVTKGMILISSVICGLIVISRIVSGLQEAMQDGQIDIKSFFKLFSTYIYMLLAITLAPVAFGLVEKGLAQMSDELVAKHQGVINENLEGVIADFTNQKMDEIEEAGLVEGAILAFKAEVEILIYTIVIYITKFLYMIFASARYLYLAILKVGTPIAIVCSIDDRTRHITEAYFKNLFYCYIMLPCFLLTNNFGDQIIQNVAGEAFGVSKTEISLLILGLFLKMFLFGKAFQYARQIIS